MKKIIFTLFLLTLLVGVGYCAWSVYSYSGVTSLEVTPTVESNWDIITSII